MDLREIIRRKSQERSEALLSEYRDLLLADDPANGDRLAELMTALGLTIADVEADLGAAEQYRENLEGIGRLKEYHRQMEAANEAFTDQWNKVEAEKVKLRELEAAKAEAFGRWSNAHGANHGEGFGKAHSMPKLAEKHPRLFPQGGWTPMKE